MQKEIKGVMPTDYALPKHVAGNVGATWKTKCRSVRKLDFRIRRKIGNHTYMRVG